MPSSRSKKSESNSKGTKRTTTSSNTSSQHGQHHRPGSSRSRSPTHKIPCRNLTTQSIPYPVPPSFQGDPSVAASSPLLPKCPLDRCPFEERNRCWNCCWCGKSWNERGRCECTMLIEGNYVRCEHICCETCTAAMPVEY